MDPHDCSPLDDLDAGSIQNNLEWAIVNWQTELQFRLYDASIYSIL